MKINQPIIILGTGRCGSTVLHALLAKHPEVMWLSGVADRYPSRPLWNRYAVITARNPLLPSFLANKIQPSEAYRFWDKHAYGFSAPCRDLVGADLTVRVRKQVRQALEPMLTHKRDRLLIKVTGWPRIGFLNGLFEDAKFVHIIRDGRAVASSLLHVGFWRGWQGPQGWRAGLLSAADQADWERYDRSFVALAGLEWRIQMRAIEAARGALDPKRFSEVRYEEFCERPLETYRRVLEVLELPAHADAERQVEAASIKSTSNRWQNDLTPRQQKILDELLHQDLLRYGYGDLADAEKLQQAVAP